MTRHQAPIADHGLIGDLQTAPLVSTGGAIDWFCCPRFDSASVFGALLDPGGGHCRIRPVGEPYTSRQFYFPGAAVLIIWLAANWDQPEEGIWETREGKADFTYGRLMSWVAFDRGIRLATAHGQPCALDSWRGERDRVYDQIWEHGWNPLKQAFVQRYDPSASPDGLRGDEGTFSLCTFGYVTALARAGYPEKARLVFEKMLTYANHVGLYAEEIGPTGEQLGNFPQAFTHLGLIDAALTLDGAIG